MLAFNTHWPWLDTAIFLTGLALVALVVNLAIRGLLLRGFERLLARTAWGRDPELRRPGVAEKLAMAAPAMVIAAGAGLTPHVPEAFVTIMRNVANAVIILAVAMAGAAALNVADVLYHRRPEARLKPLKGYFQIAKIAIYVVAALLMVAAILDRSPVILLSGLGAMAAVLILVFQDTLLSLVAGIQISSTDMVRVGDWIEVPGEGADGDVIEIALHTVKVQNFDRTITTVPIRKLVSGAFRNYRGMRESGARRIKRAVNIDQTSIRFLEEADVTRLSRLRLLGDYLERKQSDIARWNAQLGDVAQLPANRRRMTNIGAFRAYVEAYLRASPRVRQDLSLMARQLPPGPEGLPLEVYCFADTVVWPEYEAIQADIFDHLLAILPEFDLRVYQKPSGADVQALAGARLAG
ncbi:mechanosensitive ion channel family protein [Camelimonas abortus]|uniref:Mechanosensitive ion channel family protein n=1 Tax=Camelimonas abortus TaxID=1017184 RepID=A0ABV7LE75_9HYPH